MSYAAERLAIKRTARAVKKAQQKKRKPSASELVRKYKEHESRHKTDRHP